VEVAALVGPLTGEQPDISAITAGERIQSIRTLLQRPHPWYLLGIVTVPTAANLDFQRWLIPFDLSWGSSGTVATPLPQSIIRGVRTPLTYLMPMFVGWRGSLRLKASTLLAVNDTKMELVDLTIGGTNNITPLSSSGVYVAAEFDRRSEEGWQQTNFATNGTIEVAMPYYYRQRYRLSRITGDYTTPASAPTSNGVAVTMRFRPVTGAAIPVGDPIVQVFMSAGEDFSLGRFRFVPRLKIS